MTLLAILNALIAIPKILGYGEQAFQAIMTAYRQMEVNREIANAKVTDSQVKDAIDQAKASTEKLNDLWK